MSNVIEHNRYSGTLFESKEYIAGDVTLTASKGYNFAALCLGHVKSGDTEDLPKTETLKILQEIGFVRFDELIPIIGEELVMDIVEILKENNQNRAQE